MLTEHHCGPLGGGLGSLVWLQPTLTWLLMVQIRIRIRGIAYNVCLTWSDKHGYLGLLYQGQWFCPLKCLATSEIQSRAS